MTSDTEKPPVPRRLVFVLTLPEFDRRWVERMGHSYFVEDTCDHVRFACRFCNEDITDAYNYHCWDCMSKYCRPCRNKHDYGFSGYSVKSGCPNDAPHKEK